MDASIASQNLSADPHAFLHAQPKSSKPFVTVATPYCDYYSGCFIENITIRPSSDEVQKFLKSSGLRPINNIVDVTNFILLEQGQPLHAFDADRIKGSLCVRTAREGEHLETLDGIKRTLPSEAVVVADGEKVLSLAGIMGGEESGISERTHRIFIECAHFDADNIRVVSQKTNLSSDSSYRFERFVDKTRAPSALVRAIELLRETCPNLKITFFTESGSCAVAMRAVRVRLEKIRCLIGFEVEEKTFCDALEALGFRLETIESDVWDVTVPSWRQDVTLEADFAEEFIRFFGTDRIPSNVPGGIACELTDASEHTLRLKHAEILSNAGFYECYTDSLSSKSWYEGFLPKEQLSALTLEKSLSEEHACLRFSLIPGLVGALSENRNRGNRTEHLFETGRIFKVNAKGQLCECFATAFVVCPSREQTWKAGEGCDFYRAQTLVQALIVAGGVTPSAVLAAGKDVSPLWQDGYGGTVGRWEQRGFEANLGFLNLDFTQRWFKEEAVLAAECFWLPERIRIPSSKILQPYAETPTVTKDLALWVPKETLCETVRQTLVKLLKKLTKHPVEVRDVRVFDVFEDLKNDRKSFAFTLTFGASTGTLKDEQVRPIFEGLQEQIERSGTYRVRDGS